MGRAKPIASDGREAFAGATHDVSSGLLDQDKEPTWRTPCQGWILHRTYGSQHAESILRSTRVIDV